jgi:acetolactate synthase-1/2/3 large subunit
MDYCRMQPCSVRALGDTALGIPELTRSARSASPATRAAEEDRRPQGRDRQAPRSGLGASGSRTRKKTGTPRRSRSRGSRMEVWDVIKDEDWVLTANDLKHQVRKLWDFDKPYRHPGVELGTSTQIGISLGVALAHRDKAARGRTSSPTAT